MVALELRQFHGRGLRSLAPHEETNRATNRADHLTSELGLPHLGEVGLLGRKSVAQETPAAEPDGYFWSSPTRMPARSLRPMSRTFQLVAKARKRKAKFICAFRLGNSGTEVPDLKIGQTEVVMDERCAPPQFPGFF